MFAANERVLVLTDFDGVLSDLIDDPTQSHIREGSRTALTALLQQPFTDVGIVTGRTLADIMTVGRPPEGMLVVASHGLEFLNTNPYDDVYRPTEDESRALSSLSNFLRPLAAIVPGAWLEFKPAGIAVHVRLCEPAAGRTLLTQVRELPEHIKDLTIRGGKDVLEFSVSNATKGTALSFLGNFTQTKNILFLGDDVTDEDAFAALPPSGIGIKVGSGETLATHRI
ncbi:MAG: trehalose-phosphatase, partial [Microbacteriaceae bacterium]|nr:trehalose-phosphatase [Microbacteriaceae bacterium]